MPSWTITCYSHPCMSDFILRVHSCWCPQTRIESFFIALGIRHLSETFGARQTIRLPLLEAVGILRVISSLEYSFPFVHFRLRKTTKFIVGKLPLNLLSPNWKVTLPL